MCEYILVVMYVVVIGSIKRKRPLKVFFKAVFLWRGVFSVKMDKKLTYEVNKGLLVIRFI